ncbi:mitogen-activated kinase kinase kinase 17-like [Paramuricea clavata]|uniref:Mitogen-activated kinase kinase kinase 17-like n=1 Tax=Paramuricea clavata TaxID=317549 RepID=A0A6S7J8S7_PARCT|nr:mitogen-activated kinase kinase kinase 17-like [Paramuricea clavata]
MKPVFKCLAFMHEKGYVHGDLKPDNILYGDNDVKVGDFGLAVDRSETLNIGFCGTVTYMPKELFCGHGEYRPSVDIYEAAGVLSYLLTGSPPWAGYQWDTVIFKVGSGEIPEVPNNCSEEMKNLLKRMFNPDSEKRPTAKELLQDPIFSDTPESVLDEVLLGVLVDTQLLRNYFGVCTNDA